MEDGRAEVGINGVLEDVFELLELSKPRFHSSHLLDP